MRPHLSWIIGILSAAVVIFGLPVAVQAQRSEEPGPAKPATIVRSASVAEDPATPLVDSDKFFENNFLRVYFNANGQFIITAREAITKSEVPLLYTGLIHESAAEAWSTYATVRYRYRDTPVDSRNRGQWSVEHTSGTVHPSAIYVDTNGDRAQIVYALPRADELLAADGSELPSPLPICGMYLTQSLSFMTNPFTGREDMVRIRYTLAHEQAMSLRRCSTENNTLGNVEFDLRLLLDTQIGATDNAHVVTPGPGAAPDYLRVFATKTPEVTDWQALIDLSSSQQPGAPQVSVSTGEWGKYHADKWGTYTGADSPIDSAVAIRWDGLIDPWSEVFEIGYGLAPARGGESWIDAPVILPHPNTMRSHVYATNPVSATRLHNGSVTLTLPPGMTVPIAAASKVNDDGNVWEALLGDVEPGAVKHAEWEIAVTGPPGHYVYTTTTRFDGAPVNIVTSGVELKQSFGFSSLHTIVPEGNPAANGGSYEVAIEVQRYNSDGKQANVTFATADDAGNVNAALASSDYMAVTQPLIFAAGEITKTVTVTILDDSEAESDESILLTLSAPSTGAVVLDQGKALLTIVDNDEALYSDFLNLPIVATARP